ncbi:erythromycin esterase family protein [Nonomuraea sp. MCN248]|uniref:Erythromycin esterase family protein n=1 Tax=Nonomuraea corallina TaxID=2989783 RepID=A0ABT4SH17_9ACTN|nr:erythromycin esterase family protein [Nonomuraea corallina]MDA0636497.1 erythromycin esterase family protein [Nonomuraea corallina]
MTEAAEVTGWLASRAVPLDGLDPCGPVAGLEPLREVLDGVRVVGLGEATHGTREFFLLKHRLLRFLVEELGFTALAMEASVSASEALDAYVLGGRGEPERLLADLGFWIWRTREMLGVVEWMREHNRTAEPKVRFVGIDPQFPAASLRWLRDHLGERAGESLGPLAVLEETRLGVGEPLDPAIEAAARRLADEMEAGGPREAAAHARTVWQFATLVTRPMRDADGARTAAAARDLFLADNVDRLLEDPAAKIATWAHNGHVAAGHYAGHGAPVMGGHLRRRHGAGYYALGLLFGQGEFRARRLRFGRPDVRRPPVRHRVPAAGRPDVAESLLAAACPRDHVVDLRLGPRPEAVTRWLGEQRYVRGYGATAWRWSYKQSFTPAVLGAAFDGLAYIARGTCSTPL